MNDEDLHPRLSNLRTTPRFLANQVLLRMFQRVICDIKSQRKMGSWVSFIPYFSIPLKRKNPNIPTLYGTTTFQRVQFIFEKKKVNFLKIFYYTCMAANLSTNIVFVLRMSFFGKLT